MNRIAAILGLFMCLGVSAQSEKLLADRAKALMDAGDYVMAIRLYDELIKLNDRNDVYFLNRGWSQLNESGFEKGHEDLLRSLELNSKCSRCYIGLAIFTLRGARVGNALDLANDAIRLNDTASFNYYIRAQIHEASSNFKEAEQDYNRAILLNRNVADYYYTRGSFLFRQGQTEFAINDFDQAIRINKGVPDYYFQRGYCYYLVKRLEEAYSDMLTAISMDGNNGDYYLARGAIEDAMGNKENAVISYTYCIDKSPENPLAHFNRANVYYELNDLDKSCIDYSAALELLKGKRGELNDNMANEVLGMMSNHCDTSLASYYYQRGLLAADLLQFTKAVDFYNQGLEKWPGHPLLNTYKGNALLYLKQYPEAEAAYTKALTATEAIPVDVSKSYLLITEKIDINGYMRSTYSTTYDGRSKARLAQGRSEEALQDIEKAIFLGEKIENYNIGRYHIMRANVLADLGRYAEASEVLNLLISGDPNLAEAYVIRARISMERALANSGKKVKIVHGQSKESGMYYMMKPKKIKSKNVDRLLLQSALEDTKTALAIRPNFSEAFFVQGQVKYYMGMQDYCADFLLATEFGVSDAMRLMENPCEEIKN